MVLEASSPKSRCQQYHSSSELWGEILPFSSSISRCFLAYGSITQISPLSSRGLLCVSPLCLLLLPRGHLSLSLESTWLIQDDLKTLSLNYSCKTLSKQVSFMDTGVWTWTYLGGGHSSTHCAIFMLS